MSLTVEYIKKKAGIFRSEEMGRVLGNTFSYNNPKDLHMNIAISLLYYSMMIIKKVKLLQQKGIRLDMTSDVEVDFLYHTKCSTKGSSFRLLSWLKSTFDMYMVQFPELSNDNTPFLKN